MTTKQYATDHLVTEEEAAELDFEPMHFDGEPDWSRFTPDEMKLHRFAFLFLQKTKPELMEIADTIDDETGHALVAGFTELIERYRADAEMLDVALARLMTAVATCSVRDGRKETWQ